MSGLDYRYDDPIIRPGYVHVYRDGELFAEVYAQYASVGCYHQEHPWISVGGVQQSDCPEIIAIGRDEFVRGARQVMCEHYDAEEARRLARQESELTRPGRTIPPDVTRLFERYGGMRAIMEHDLPSDRADEAEDIIAAQRLREYDL